MKAKRYDILSPDGFSINRERTYKTQTEALKAFESWLTRYNEQGYYSYNRERIPLSDVQDYCRLITL